MKTAKSIEQQITEALTRAKAARIEIDTTNSTRTITYVTSEQDACTTYAVTRNAEGMLVCTCPSRVVCKHVAIVMLANDEPYAVTMEQAVAARLEAFQMVDAWLATVQDAPVAPLVGYDVVSEAEQIAAQAAHPQWSDPDAEARAEAIARGDGAYLSACGLWLKC